MQILHPFAGSLQQYSERLADPDYYRPGHCPQCHAKQPLTAHGFYTRTLVDAAFDGVIRVRRYLCQACRRTVSLLPEFILPYLRSSVLVIALFLVARLLGGQTVEAAARSAPPPMPYQRGQFWIRRFRTQAESLCAALAALTPPTPAPDFVHRALTMLQSAGWIAAHRFLFAGVRCHLLGWPRGLAPDGRRVAFSSAAAPV
jgi:transposase-like protein